MGVTALCLVVAVRLRKAFDPHCHEGVLNTPMTACCQADCGMCDENSDVCKAADLTTRNPNGRGSTCCPAQIIADAAPSCENSMAPCLVPEYVRNPKAQTYDAVHAQHDCNKVVRATSQANHLATAYVKYPTKTGDATKDCSTTYGTLEQAAAACSDSDTCLGFDSQADAKGEEKPSCLYQAGNVVATLTTSSDSIYLKREDAYTGETFRFTVPVFGACSKTCGGGVQVSSVAEGCESTAGMSRPLGLCSNLVAMSPQAQPVYSRDCNKHDCPVEDAAPEVAEVETK